MLSICRIDAQVSPELAERIHDIAVIFDFDAEGPRVDEQRDTLDVGFERSVVVAVGSDLQLLIE